MKWFSREKKKKNVLEHNINKNKLNQNAVYPKSKKIESYKSKAQIFPKQIGGCSINTRQAGAELCQAQAKLCKLAISCLEQIPVG